MHNDPGSDDSRRCASVFLRAVGELVALPHILLHLESHLVDIVGSVTGSIPGLWPVDPPYGSETTTPPGGVHLDDNVDNEPRLPFEAWSHTLNQELLRELCHSQNAILSNNYLLLDTKLGSSAVAAVLPSHVICPIREGGAMALDIAAPIIQHHIHALGWAVLPCVHVDCGFMIFVCDPSRRGWIHQVASLARQNRVDHLAFSSPRMTEDRATLNALGTVSGFRVDCELEYQAH